MRHLAVQVVFSRHQNRYAADR